MLKKRLKLYKFVIVLVLGFLVCNCCVYAKQQSSKKSSTTVDYVFIGDSRFVGASSVIHGWSTESGEIIKTADNEHWICKSGTSLSAYKSTIKRELKKYKKNHTVIVYELGVNALTEIDSDIAFVKELEAEGWNVYYCDMLPINDSIFQHYSTFPNESIVQEQNEKIYNSGLKVVYFHDTCYENYIDKTDDGLHYYREVYQQWYDQIKIQTHYLSEITNAQNEQIQYELTEILDKFDDTTETVIKESELVELNKKTTVTANVCMLDTQTEVQTLAMSINVGEQEPKENEVTVTDNQQVEVVSEQNQSANSSGSNSYLSRIPSNVMNHLYASLSRYIWCNC